MLQKLSDEDGILITLGVLVRQGAPRYAPRTSSALAEFPGQFSYFFLAAMIW
jgi:hypothetical protein